MCTVTFGPITCGHVLADNCVPFSKFRKTRFWCIAREKIWEPSIQQVAFGSNEDFFEGFAGSCGMSFAAVNYGLKVVGFHREKTECEFVNQLDLLNDGHFMEIIDLAANGKPHLRNGAASTGSTGPICTVHMDPYGPIRPHMIA